MSNDDGKPQGIRAPAAGVHVNHVLVPDEGSFDDLPETGRHLVTSLPPGDESMRKWIKSMERRMASAKNERESMSGIKGIRKTKELFDLMKYFGSIVVALVGFGFVGADYLDQFQTDEEATAAAEQQSESISAVSEAMEENSSDIGDLQVSGVRIEIQQRNTNDRLDQLLILQQAGTTRREQRAARGEVDVIQRRIDRRERVLHNRHLLRRLADQVESDPLRGLNGL